MGDVVEFPGSSADDGLAEQIRTSLVARGSARAVVAELGVSAAQWRKLARQVARSLGRPVQTLEGTGQVHAVLKDWPATPAEEAITDAALRRVMDTASKNWTNL